MNSFKQDDDGFTGLEAAIVLIAFVVVAAVFSYVVLGAGFFTTQKAQQAVYQGVQQATTNVLLKGSVYATASAPSSGINGINFTLGLAPGAPTMDVTKIQIVWSNETTAPIIMSYTTPTTSAPAYGNFTASATSISGDSTVNIWFGIPDVPTGSVMNFEIRPPAGGATIPFTKTVPPAITPVNVLR
ncbi:MAG: archaellin/type IV pilin N-terminal domain-containing protein [Methanoregulaceae archaeon]|jgi:flagellin FlaB